MYNRYTFKICKLFRNACVQHHAQFVTETPTHVPPVRHSQVDAVHLAYATYEDTKTNAANADPLLIIHGLMGSKNNWTSICKGLLKTTNPPRKIIAVDVRNHGESPHSYNHDYQHMTADILKLLKTLSINKVCLLGHSMGGRAVMYMALKYPSIVERLIVVDISPVNDNNGMGTLPIYFKAMQLVQLENLESLTAARKEADLQLAKYIQNQSIRQFLLLNLIQKEDGSYSWRVNLPTLVQKYDEIATFPDVGTTQYKKPTMFIAGTLSDFLPKTDIPAIQRMFPTAEFNFVENADHWVHAERPNEFLGLTTAFLNKPN